MQPGIYPAITMADYLSDPCEIPSLSASCALKLIMQSPLHAWHSHPKLNPSPDDREAVQKADIGTVVHDLFLGGEGTIDVLEFNDFRTKAAQEARDLSLSQNRTPILSHHYALAQQQAEAARRYVAESEYAEAMTGGAAEQTLIWHEDGMMFRARPDWIASTQPIAIHFKTTEGSASPRHFIPRIWRAMNYAFTLAFYARGFKALTGKDVLQLALVQEQSAPFACSLIRSSPAEIAMETVRVERAVKLWRRCMTTGVWPGYGKQAAFADPAPWVLAEEEALMAEGEGE